MARRMLVTSLYLLVAWILMVSYQFFTQTAFTTIISDLHGPVPLLASWLNANISLAVFICGFAWMFVLSSVITGLIIGRDRRMFIQFIVSLALTSISSLLISTVKEYGNDFSNPLFTQIFSNIYFAFFYLVLPFLFMIAIDLRPIIKRK